MIDTASDFGSLVAMRMTRAGNRRGQRIALNSQKQNEPICYNGHQDCNGSQGLMTNSDLRISHKTWYS